jgi:transposase-like protein
MLTCRHCGSERTRKNGLNYGTQRYKCNTCGRTFSATPPKYGDEIKRKALLMYLNNVGIRKTALFLGTSRTSVLNWIKQKHTILQEMIHNFQPNVSESADIIEMDEIYTFVQKNSRGQSFGLLSLGEKIVLLHLK